MRRRSAVVLLALLLTGCGPQAPLELAVRKIPINILLGAQLVINAITNSTPTLPPPPSQPVVLPPQTIIEEATPAPLPPPPSPQPCPALDPFAFPQDVAPADLSGTVQPNAYIYRNEGSWQPDTTKKTVYAFPPEATHYVANIQPAAGGSLGAYSFDLHEGYTGLDGHGSSVTTFFVQPTNPTSSGTGAVVTQAAGIYITRIVTDDGHGNTSVFSPNPPINVLQLPLSFGLGWDTAGSDGSTTLRLHMAIDDSAGSRGGKRTVNACGTALDAWEVHAQGNYVTPNVNLTVDWVYDIGTEYGGLPLRTVYKATGTIQGVLSPTVLSNNVSTINVVPR